MRKKQKSNNIIVRLFSVFKIETKQNESVNDVKANLLTLILYILNILGLPLIFIIIIEAIKLNQFYAAISYFLFFLPIFAAFIFRKKIPYKLTVFLLLLSAYLISIGNLYIYGFTGANIPIFLTIFALTSLFFNLKSGLVSIIVCVIPMIIFGYLFTHNILLLDISLHNLLNQNISWISSIFTLVFLGSIIVVSFGFTQYKMSEKILFSEQQAVGLEQDIINRKLIEEKLKKKEERLSLALDGSDSGIWDWNIKTGKVFFDSNYFTISGYKQDEFPHSYEEWKKRVHPDDLEQAEEKITKYINGKSKVYSAEFRFKAKNNSWMWILSKGKIFEWDNEENPVRFTGTHTDITSNKSTEKALEKSGEKLKNLNATKDKFFSIIAHDLKGPFNTMLGFSKLLVNNFDKYDIQKQKKFIDLLNQDIKNTYKLLENLLLWSRSQKGTIDFYPEKENLYLLSYETVELLKQTSDNKLITIENKMPENIIVNADKDMLATVFRNLISNAIKFTEKGGKIVISASLEVDKNKKMYTKIVVKDNGVGISPEIQLKLFKISENISTKGTEKETGTSLGLVLCKEFVEKHGGEIWVESEVGKGSKFIFTLALY